MLKMNKNKHYGATQHKTCFLIRLLNECFEFIVFNINDS